MGYRITYENGVIRKQALRKYRVKWKLWGTGVLVAGLVVALMVPQGRLWVRDLVLPGDEDVTAAALEGMVSDLRSGESIGVAVEAFCQEILSGGT